MTEDYDEKKRLDRAWAVLARPLASGKRLLATDELLHHGGILAGATIVSGALDYAFQVFMGRALGPSQYGVFGALFALFYLIEILGSGIRLSASRFISELNEHDTGLKAVHRGFVTRSLLFGSGICILLILVSPLISQFLKLPSVWPIVLVGVTIPFGFPIMANRGSFQGVQQFTLLGAYSIVQSSTKLVASIVLVLIGYEFYGAFGSLVIAAVTACVLTTIHARRCLSASTSFTSSRQVDYRNIYQFAPPAILVGFCLTVPANVDVILVQHFFTGKQAGLYTAASVFGKVLIFLPMGISGALFPKVTSDYTRRNGHKKRYQLLHRALLYTAITAGAGSLVFWFLPTTILDLLFNEAYKAAAPLIRWYGIAIFAFVLAVVVLKFELARDRMQFVYTFTAVTIAEIGLMGLFHGSMIRIIQLMLIVNLGLFVWGVIQVRR